MTTISPSGTALVTLDDLASAARAMAPVAVHTPVRPFDAVSVQNVVIVDDAAPSERLVRPSSGSPTVAVLRGGSMEWDGLRELLGRGP